MNNIILKLLTGSNKYAGKTAHFSSKLVDSNNSFVEVLKSLGITKVNMTALGNSIATGYSISDIIKPLLLRNSELQDLLTNNGIESDYYNFARAQDNNEEHLLEWISNNIKQSEINSRNHIDLNGGINSMERSGITDEEVDRYFPLQPKKDKGLQDIILEKADDKANILIYTGCTGSFLDNITRKGQHLNMNGFKRDLIGLESILKTIYLKNPNTQIYICGISNLLSINLVYLINRHIKAMCEKYSNATYVNPAPARMFYNKAGKLVIDIHHNQSEYLNLNNNIISSIVDNYIKNAFFIEMDKSLSGISNKIQYETPELRGNKQIIDDKISVIISKYKPLMEKQGQDFDATLNEFIGYYKERYPHDYFYTPKNETIDILKNQK